MSDGTTLVGDVHLPHAKGQFPAILRMTPYGQASYTRAYVDQGYARVNVDVRGSGRSGGTLCAFCTREQKDAYEVVEWVAKQKWSNGKVGMDGGSYLGITALHAAAKQAPHLKAIVPSVAYSDAYRDIAWHNGMPADYFVLQWMLLQPTLGMTNPAPHPRTLERLRNPFNPYDFVHSNEFDGSVWRERALYNKVHRIKIPTMLISGWFDGFARGNIWNFQRIPAKHLRLVMQPGTHKSRAGGPWDPLSPYTADGQHPDNPDDTTLAWFDRFLKGKRNGIENAPRMQYYDLGAYKWKETNSWPPPGTKIERLFLSGERSGSAASLNDGSLSPKRPQKDATEPDAFYYDPTQGAAETFSKWGALALTPHIRLDHRAEEAHALTYTTSELKKPLTLAGPIELHMWGETTAQDTDWVAKVTDVAPNGSSMLITSGYMRASHRAWAPARSRPAEPWILNDKPYAVPPGPLEYRIDIWHTAYELQKRHRLRVTIMSSDIPNHKPLLMAATNTVFHDSRHPSTLLLTVMP